MVRYVSRPFVASLVNGMRLTSMLIYCVPSCCTVPQITQISPDASTTGTTTITISGSQFGPSAGAASAPFVSYTGQQVSLFGDPQISGFNSRLACGQLVVGSSSVMRCTPPALSGGPASFAVRYKVCVTIPAVGITTCLTSRENTPGQFNFRYTAPSVVAISPGGSSSPISTSGGGAYHIGALPYLFVFFDRRLISILGVNDSLH